MREAGSNIVNLAAQEQLVHLIIRSHHQAPFTLVLYPEGASARLSSTAGFGPCSWTMSSSSVDRIALSTSLKIRLFPAAAWMLRRAEVGRLARLSNNHPNTSSRKDFLKSFFIPIPDTVVGIFVVRLAFLSPGTSAGARFGALVKVGEILIDLW